MKFSDFLTTPRSGRTGSPLWVLPESRCGCEKAEPLYFRTIRIWKSYCQVFRTKFLNEQFDARHLAGQDLFVEEIAEPEFESPEVLRVYFPVGTKLVV